MTEFEDEMRKIGVIPLDSRDEKIAFFTPKIAPQIPKKSLEKNAPWRDLAHDLDEIPTAHAKNGIAKKSLRALKRGDFEIDARIDLHGFTVDAARAVLFQFLESAQNQGARAVLVIHGRGITTESREGVLKKLTRGWLFQSENVLAYTLAPPQWGGEGATLALLKKSTVDEKFF